MANRRTAGRLPLVAALSAALVLGLAGLGWARQPEAVEPVAQVRVALPGFENNITPFTHVFGAWPNTHDLIHLVYDSLFWSQALDDPEPWLAESAEPNEDYTAWTVRLREGVTWHDGEPFTADDVVFSMEYYLAHAADSGRYAHHVADMPELESAEAVDDHTVELRFAHTAGQFKIMPGADLPIIPRHQWEGVDQPGTATEMLPVGTGPYELVDIVPDQQYRFRAHEDYFKGRPLVDELVMPIVREPAAAFAALQTGDVDHVARRVPPELIEAFERLDDVTVARGTMFESVDLFFNVPKAPLDDPALRRAIALATDRQAVLDTVLLGHGRPGRDSFVHPESPWAIDEELGEFDPAEAERVLDEAGYGERGDDGVRLGPDGQPLTFTIMVSTFEPQMIRAAQLVASQVSDVGVDLQVEALDPATIRERRQPGPDGVAPYDIRAGGLEAHAHVDPDGLYYFFHSPGERGFGGVITGYANPTFDEIAVEAGMTAELEDRRQMLFDLQRILAEDVPVLTLMYPDGVWAYRPDAYDGWIADFGHSVLTKRSFLPDYAGAQSGAGQDGGDDAPATTPLTEDAALPWGWIVAGLLFVVLVASAILSRRRSAAADE